MFFQYVPRYDLAIKALCYRHSFRAPPRFPPRPKRDAACDVLLLVTVLPDTAWINLEYHYTSGHAWMIDDERPPVDEPLDALLSAEQLDKISAIQADLTCWAPEILLSLFTPMTDTGTQRASAEEADFLELGQSVTFDGKVPLKTLRLGRRHDEIVLNHSFVWPSQERQIEHEARFDPPATRAALSAIEEAFGADMARAAAHFHNVRARRF